MRRPRWTSVAWFIGVGVGTFERPCKASEEAVRVACEDLSADGRAEVDARTRAMLLTSPVSDARITIRCEASGATAVAEAGGRSESAVVPLPNEHLEDALVEAVGRALSAVGRTPEPSASVPTGEPLPTPPSPPPPPQPAPHPARAPVEPRRPAAPHQSSTAVRLGGSFMVEHWIEFSTYGGRALVELGVGPWVTGLGLGGLAGPEQENAFGPSEWHALAFGAFDAESLAGLRLGTGVGLSVLVASPRGGVVARSRTSASCAFMEFSLSRPVRLGRFSVVPELDIRVFSRRRDIVVDGKRSFHLRTFAPSLLVGAMVEL